MAHIAGVTICLLAVQVQLAGVDLLAQFQTQLAQFRVVGLGLELLLGQCQVAAIRFDLHVEQLGGQLKGVAGGGQALDQRLASQRQLVALPVDPGQAANTGWRWSGRPPGGS